MNPPVLQTLDKRLGAVESQLAAVDAKIDAARRALDGKPEFVYHHKDVKDCGGQKENCGTTFTYDRVTCVNCLRLLVKDCLQELENLRGELRTQQPTSPKPQENWRARVGTEKRELDAKIEWLRQFIAASPAFEAVDDRNKALLRRQLELMVGYSAILGERLATE